MSGLTLWKPDNAPVTWGEFRDRTGMNQAMVHRWVRAGVLDVTNPGTGLRRAYTHGDVRDAMRGLALAELLSTNHTLPLLAQALSEWRRLGRPSGHLVGVVAYPPAFAPFGCAFTPEEAVTHLRTGAVLIAVGNVA